MKHFATTTIAIATATALCAGSVFAAEMSPVGSWKTIDDKTGKEKSIVTIASESNGTLSGKVDKVLNSDKGPNPLCDACEGERKNQPVTGMTILWGVKKDGEVWDGGAILDPNNGKTYSVKLKPIDNGSKLEVRGFLGFSLLGRTQVWQRVSP